MRTFKLCGLAEGVVGRSSVQAKSAKAVFAQFPALAAVKEKLTVTGTRIGGFVPCDG